MLSFNRALGFALLLAFAGRGYAQAQQVQGFDVERFYPSAPGAGWLVMDDLNMQGSLGGAFEASVGYARNPLRVTDGETKISVVSYRAVAGFGASITHDQWRFYLNVNTPIAIFGQSGALGKYSFTGPSVDWGSTPDLASDARVGSDVRIVGTAGDPFRFGVGAQLLIPFGSRAAYDGDGIVRGMVRGLFAGDSRHFTYAGQLGIHIRPLSDSPELVSAHGSELLFGAAAGTKLSVEHLNDWAFVIGPELYGATAFRSFFGSGATALEGLLSGRIEGTRSDRLQVRVKVGAGGGLYKHFGAPDWRIIAAIEMFNFSQAR